MEFALTEHEMRKKIVIFIISIIAIPAIYVGCVLFYATLTDYTPPAKEGIKVNGNTIPLATDSIFTCISWNIGFTGLGEETDFFYDGGKVVTQTEPLVAKNRQGILDFVKRNSDVDVYFFQEVDSMAKRSHRTNMIHEFAQCLPNWAHSFALNYNVDFVPIPFFDPMGKVKSGLCNFTRFSTDHSERISYNSQFSWPTRLFFLDRCFLVQHSHLPDGSEICLINTHCSAYDTAGVMVADEIKMLMTYADSIHQQGIPVIIGGDWNQCPPNYTPKDPKTYNEYILKDAQLPTGWRWVADVTTPTNRKLTTVYDPKTSYTSVIDHFVVSPDIDVVAIKTIDLQFAFSDHQPVRLDFRVVK